MIWPGMGDPAKRRKTLKFLATTTVIAIGVGLASSLIQGELSKNDPLKSCIDGIETPYRLSASLLLYVDGQKADIPSGIGQDECKRVMFTDSADGIIHVAWTEKYDFEIGHFFWIWDFPIRDMDQSKSQILVNGEVSDKFINAPFQEGFEYTAEFTSKAYDEAKDRDFLPPS
ncbi:MAG: hypothetical protein R1F52_01350 [Candidatus Nitrosoabyssus spongiisocia]|nr:MAG: hypothetical protein R1F52_01350 [Nitrosopumilaceae archaeon AB1(1)]